MNVMMQVILRNIWKKSRRHADVMRAHPSVHTCKQVIVDLPEASASAYADVFALDFGKCLIGEDDKFALNALDVADVFWTTWR